MSGHLRVLLRNVCIRMHVLELQILEGILITKGTTLEVRATLKAAMRTQDTKMDSVKADVAVCVQHARSDTNGMVEAPVARNVQNLALTAFY